MSRRLAKCKLHEDDKNTPPKKILHGSKTIKIHARIIIKVQHPQCNWREHPEYKNVQWTAINWYMMNILVMVAARVLIV